MSKLKKRAFVRYTKQGKIVPGSLIVTHGSYPSGPSTWKEVPINLCCTPEDCCNPPVPPVGCDCRLITGADSTYSYTDCQGNYIECAIPGECIKPEGCIDISKHSSGILYESTPSLECQCSWKFNPDRGRVWPDNQDGYTLYTGGWSQYDDGNTTNPTSFGGTFNSNGQWDTEFYLSTNGWFYGPNSGMFFYGNQGDLYLTPGASLTDGDTQNFWYKNTTDGSKWSTSILVYCGACCGPISETTPWSYMINIYKDANYQYIETQVKTTIGASAGPDGVTYAPSTSTQVWRSPADGSSWTYLGFGSIS